MSLAARIRETRAPGATFLIRLAVGSIFLSEGVQKFLYPDTLGFGRFARIGLPYPHILAPFVGACEVVFGALVLIGLWTRLAALPLLVIISTALVTTKAPLLAQSGFWAMAHEARTDLAMFLSLLFLLVVGAGRFSCDRPR